MITAALKFLFLDGLDEYVRKAPSLLLWLIFVVVSATTWIVPDIIPGLEETFAGLAIYKCLAELTRRRQKKIEEERKRLERVS